MKKSRVPNPCLGAAIQTIMTPTDWFGVHLPFKPSVTQLKRYAEHFGQKMVINYQNDPPSVTFDDDAVRTMMRRYPDDPLYPLISDYRELEKLNGTYVEGIVPAFDGRYREEFRHNPKTLRLAMRVLQLLPRFNKDEPNSLYNEVRGLFVAAPGKILLERDFCVSPDAKILLKNLTWKRAGDIKTGDEVIGFDEDFKAKSGLGKGKRQRNAFRPSVVTATRILTRPRVKVITDKGTTIVATKHPFVARYRSYGRRWIEAQNLKPGMIMPFLNSPWETDETREGGYLAGFFDGEGWVHRTSFGVGQKKGEVLDRVLKALEERGFQLNCYTRHSDQLQYACVNGIGEQLRLLGTLRPTRLLKKSDSLWSGRAISGKKSKLATVLSVEPIDEGEVIAIETTTQTYISDGYFSHNSGIEAVNVMYLADDPVGYRLAAIVQGMHDFVATTAVGRPPDLKWSDKDLSDYFAEFRKEDRNWRLKSGQELSYITIRYACKRAVFLSFYGGGPGRLLQQEPKTFGTKEIAQFYQDIILKETFPSIEKWQWKTCEEAERRGFVTAPSGFRMYYPDGVFNYSYSKADKKWNKKFGEIAKECIASKPQHMGMKFSADALVELGSDELVAETLRLSIHDAIMTEVEVDKADEVDVKLQEVMERSMRCMPLPPEWGYGEYVRVRTERKIGTRWSKMK